MQEPCFLSVNIGHHPAAYELFQLHLRHKTVEFSVWNNKTKEQHIWEELYA